MAKVQRIDSIGRFIRETQATSLHLEYKKIDADDLSLLSPHLVGSQVEELSLTSIDLANGMRSLCEVLPNTKIKKLDVQFCSLTNQDLLDILTVSEDIELAELFIHFNNFNKFEGEECYVFFQLIQASHLQIFGLDLKRMHLQHDALFFQVLPHTSIAQVELGHEPSDEILRLLFSNLGQSSLIEIMIHANRRVLDLSVWTELSRNLRKSKLEKLYVTCSDIEDRHLDILIEGLIHSKVVDLHLASNKIQGSTPLGCRLKDTRIQKLTLSGNPLDCNGVFMSPDYLRSSSITDLSIRNCQFGAEQFRRIMQSVKFSTVTDLYVGCNNLQLRSIYDFAEVVEDTNLKRVSFEGNNLSEDALSVLVECIKKSKLTHLDISNCLNHPGGKNLLPAFLEKVKGTPIDSVKATRNGLGETGANDLADHFSNISFTHFNLGYNQIGNGAIRLAEKIKYSCLTHLGLCKNGITDEGAEALAANLKETRLVELELSDNLITSRGAGALADILKDCSLLNFNLFSNKIGNDGLEALAEGAKNTFITKIGVSAVPGDGFILLDAVLWENKTARHFLVRMFKLIALQSPSDIFHFDGNTGNQNDAMFLENCLQLYADILQKPSALKALKEDKAILLKEEEIIHLMSNEFPIQFSQFVARSIGPDVKWQVRLLKNVEDKGLSEVVKSLLLNRPLYTIDENKSFLHPYVYLLLNKYNLPLYNLDVEPNAKINIIKYLEERRPRIKGTRDVIRMLRKRKLNSGITNEPALRGGPLAVEEVDASKSRGPQ